MTLSPSLCIFANFFIDNDERLQRMKDSFFSFCDVRPEEWKINIRGRLKHEASDFLHSELGEKVETYFLESPRGWLYDSYSYMRDVSSEYVLFWIEDHICLVEPDYLRVVLTEMSFFSVDQLLYSFLQSALSSTYAFLPQLDSLEHITTYKLDRHSAKIARNTLKRDFYCVATVSIFRTEFFLFLLRYRRPWFKRWTKYVPHDFEKKSKDFFFPLFLNALPKKELFACIDDDHGIIGSSLISRGTYPNRISRTKMKSLEYENSRLTSRYLFLPSFFRRLFSYIHNLWRRLLFTFSYFIY